jgi:hypothetical protein
MTSRAGDFIWFRDFQYFLNELIEHLTLFLIMGSTTLLNNLDKILTRILMSFVKILAKILMTTWKIVQESGTSLHWTEYGTWRILQVLCKIVARHFERILQESYWQQDIGASYNTLKFLQDFDKNFAIFLSRAGKIFLKIKFV